MVHIHEHVRSKKSYLYSLTLLVLLIFLLSSCGVKETTSADTGMGGGTPNTLQQIIESGNLAGLVGNTDPLVTNTLSYLTGSANYNANTTLTAIYATENGSGNESGTNWANSIAAINLRNRIDGITDATETKVYVVLVAGGTYKPTAGTDRTISFSMKDHVAIVGGFVAEGGWELTGTTTFSGDIGTTNDNIDNTYQVFRNDLVFLNNAVLYGVIVTGGNANGTDRLNFGGGMYNRGASPKIVNVQFVSNRATSGGGMYNDTSLFQVLTGVVFNGNSATINGGGIYNERSYPTLTGVVFTGNSATIDGGGIYNKSSIPKLTGVVFSSNSATRNGGGIYNETSILVLTEGVFTGNSATGNGGGMYDETSTSVLTGAVFNNNGAATGGGMYIDNDAAGESSRIVNSIFSENTAGVGSDIALNLDTSVGETIRIAGSVLGIGLRNPTDGIVGVGTAGQLNLTYYRLTNGSVNFGTTTIEGYPTIMTNSSAIDIGLYVRRVGGISGDISNGCIGGCSIQYYYFYSGDARTWHTAFTSTNGLGPAVALRESTEDLTVTDIAGNIRVGRPDAGVYEYEP